MWLGQAEEALVTHARMAPKVMVTGPLGAGRDNRNVFEPWTLSSASGPPRRVLGHVRDEGVVQDIGPVLFCELDGQRSSPRKGAHRLLGLLAMIKSRASTHSCFPVFGFLAMIKSRASTRSSWLFFCGWLRRGNCGNVWLHRTGEVSVIYKTLH